MSKEDRDDILAARAADAMARVASAAKGKDMSEWEDESGSRISTAPRIEAVCHDEQMTVWASDFVGMLSLGDWLRDLSYDDGIELDRAIKRELRSIIGMAFNHPELQKPRWGWPQDFSKAEHDGT